MKSFEEFQQSRSAVDPSTRKMTDHQWEQAYAAYVSSRERVRSPSSGSGSEEKRGRRRRSSSASSSGRGAHVPTLASETTFLRTKIRNETAYADLRMLVDVFAWIAVALIVVGVIIKVIGFPNPTIALGALVGGCVQVVLALALRLLAQAFIDLPDIALYHENRAKSASVENDDGSEADG